MNLSDEEMIQMAIDASIADQVSNNRDLVFSSVETKQRTDLCRNDKHKPQTTVDGTIIQINTLNQFHEAFLESINEFSTPSSICGYFVMAHSIILSQLIPETGIRSHDELETIVSVLKDLDAVLPEVRKAMDFVKRQREQYINDHPNDFKSERDKRMYLRAWVANYEISDYIRHTISIDEQLIANHIHFLRFNQWPEVESATHEELERLISEEAKFGGQPGEKGAASYAENDSVFILETFKPERQLLSPEEFLQQTESSTSKTFVLDLNGHFVISTMLKSESNEPLLVVLNTTPTTNLGGTAGLMIATAFDTCFPP